jgi:cytochrome P450
VTAARDWCGDFDHHDPAFVEDPEKAFAQLRDQCPITHSDRYGGFWLLTRYGDVSDVAQDWEVFTSSVVGVTVIPPTQPRDRPQIPIELDPPLHTQYRGLVNRLFTRQAIEPLRPRLEELASEFLDAVVAAGRGELIEEFAVPMSVGTLGEFMGLPRADQPKWAGWVHRMLEGSIHDPAEQRRALAEFEAYLGELIEERKRERHQDFLSVLLDSEIDGNRLTDDEIRGFGILMLMAGHETTASAMGVTLHLLAQHPDLRRRLAAEPELIPSAVNEFLRLASPIQLLCRNAARDVELHGRRVPEGDVVAIAFGSANRDPAVFEEPERCVLDRKPNRHLAFGTGRHLCLGAPVARMEMAVMLEQVVQRMPDFALDPARDVTWKARGDVRGLATLPVVL